MFGGDPGGGEHGPLHAPETGPHSPRPRAGARVAAVVVLVAAVAGVGVAIARHGAGRDSDTDTTELTVGWGGSEGHPSCRYDASARSVEATLLVSGHAASRTEVSVTVTAYADENTSRPVGSASRTLEVEGDVRLEVVVPIAVRRPPHVDEDGEGACRLEEQH